ncbi:MAG: aminoglycoside phosphotransferase family protein [Chloroflexota bacterium]|nr:aminoglycoside phosphotransferase family protein [Chloroflexota bacterium]
MRRADPDLAPVQTLVDGIFPRTARSVVERVEEGVSTRVYRIHRGDERFYLRVLPEAGASFAPEVLAHALLRERGVNVPEVVHFEGYNDTLGRSVMVTTEIRGRPVGRRGVDGDPRHILVEAGRQLAVINSIPVAGFGWIRRGGDTITHTHLAAEHPTHRAFVGEHLEADLALLARRVLSGREIAAVREVIDHHGAWLDAERAWLAHGDFDATHIFERDGRYSGIIDFGEIRGGDRWYDLGHFRMHDGETLPVLALPWLLEGYGAVAPLPADHPGRIAFASLLIAIRALARALRKRPRDIRRHQGWVAIRRDIALLRA